MNKLFLSALLFAGMIVAIVSCNQVKEEGFQPEIEDQSNYASVFAQAKSEIPGLAKYFDEGQRNFEQMQSGEYFVNTGVNKLGECDRNILPVSGFRVVTGRTGTTTWTNNFIYVLSGPVVVGAGDVLTIEPGTVIKALPGQTTRSSFLIVDRGGQIIADGTADAPIVFTSIADRVLPGEVYPQTRPLPPGVRGLWGGVLILGQGCTNNNSTGGERNIEGIPAGGAVPTTYGGNIEEDNSGILRYVSIRHGGTEIGDGNEINGLTMGAVGSGTTIDFVEVISNRDDGFEWFGGTVNTSHLVAAFCGDDSFDYDQGFGGCGQFWFSFQEIVGDSGAEQDGGGGADECQQNCANATIVNATYKGNGTTETMGFFDNAAGKYFRSIFVNHEEGVAIEDRVVGGTITEGCDAKERFLAGDIMFCDNIFWNVAGNDRASLLLVVGDGPMAGASLTDSTDNTIIGDPLFGTGQNADCDVFECVPSSGIALFDSTLSALFTEKGLVFKEFFVDTDYAGAFAPAFEGNENASWASKWTMWSCVFANPGGNLGPGTGTESPEEN